MLTKHLKDTINVANASRPQPTEQNSEYHGCKTVISKKFFELGVQTLIQHYNNMNLNNSNPPERPPRTKQGKQLKILISTHIKNGSLKEMANKKIKDQEINGKKKIEDLKKRESNIKDDLTAFQLLSAKEKSSMNQIERNIVKRRINEYNELECVNRQQNSIDETILKNHHIFNKFNKFDQIDLEIFLDEDKSSVEKKLLVGNFAEGDIMYERYKNGRKKNLKKHQTQSEHLELVKFYRNLFSKITQIPFVIAVTYCTFFFVVEAVSLFYTFLS